MITLDDVGRLVEDSAGQVGILRAVIPDYEDPAAMRDKRQKCPTAFLWPVGGGREWLVPPDTLTPVR